MSGWTAVGDFFPGWLMQALNWGMAYPEGDQDALFALGDAWKKAAAELEDLTPDLKRATDAVPQYYTGDGAAAVAKEFATLFDGKDYSIQKLVESLESLGHDTRSTATLIEYTKIQEEVFAALTLYTALSLLSSVGGGVLVPGFLATAREVMAEFAAGMTRRIAEVATRAGLRTVARPLYREIVVPLGKGVAAIQKSSPIVRYPATALIGGVTAGGMGAGLDAGIQGLQMMMGHRDDGFDLKQTFQTSLEWGAGGLLGAPVHAVVGGLIKKAAPGLHPKLGGFLAGSVGGSAGAVGMYAAGLGVQRYDTGNWNDVDKTFHWQLLAGGMGLGGIGGAAHGLPEHGGGSRASNEPRSTPASSALSSKAHEPVLSPDTNAIHEKPVSSLQGHDSPPATLANSIHTTVDSRISGIEQAKPTESGTRPADTATRTPDAGARSTPADPTTRPTPGNERAGEPPGSRETTPTRQTPSDSPAARASTSTTPADHNAKISASTQEKQPAPASRAPEARAVPINAEPEVRSARPETPLRPASGPLESTAAPPTARTSDSVINHEVPAKNPARVPESPNSTVPTGRPPVERTLDRGPDGGAIRHSDGPPKPTNTTAPEQRRDERLTPSDNGRRDVQLSPDPAITPLTHLDRPAEAAVPANNRAGDELARRVDQRRGTASDVGDFRGDARPHDQPSLSRDDLVREIDRNRPLLESEVMSWDRDATHFVLFTEQGARLEINIDAGVVSRPNTVAEFFERLDGKGYQVVVSERARTEDVVRAVAHELTEIRLEQDPAVVRDPHTERPEQMTTHLGGRFAELEVLATQIERATSDPAQAHELPRLRRDMADLLDHLGVRDPEYGHKPWQLLTDHNLELARRISDEGGALPPPRSTTEHTPDPHRPNIDPTARTHAPETISSPHEEFRHFADHESGKEYGETVLGPIRDSLPQSEFDAVYSYTKEPWINDFLRSEDPGRLLEERALAFHDREQLRAALGDGYQPTPETIRSWLDEKNLSDLQREVVERVLNERDPQAELTRIWDEAGAYRLMELEFDSAPTPASLREYLERIDRATSHPLPESVVALRGVKSIRSMRFGEEGLRLGDGDPMLLKGTEQTHEGLLSTSLGTHPPEKEPRYLIEFQVPADSPGLWIGDKSYHPTEQELLLPHNTRYVITDVIPNPSGPHLVGVEYLIKATILPHEGEMLHWPNNAEHQTLSPLTHERPEEPAKSTALESSHEAPPAVPDDAGLPSSHEKPFTSEDNGSHPPHEKPSSLDLPPQDHQPEQTQHPNEPSGEQPTARHEFTDDFREMKDLAGRIDETTDAAQLHELRGKLADVLDRVGLLDRATANEPWQALLEHDAAFAQRLGENHETYLPKPGDHTPTTENAAPAHPNKGDAESTVEGTRPAEGDSPAEPAWTSSEDPNLTLDDAQNLAADEFLERSRANEPGITDAMQRMASETGAEMEGLQYRLKDEESFKRKFVETLEKFDGDIDFALTDMKDSVRYTATWETDRYTDSVRRAEQYLRDQGYETVKRKPTWGDEGYRGFNSFWKDPKTGQVFEVQFHTPESFDAKMRTHDLYNEIRLLPEGDPRRVELEAQQNAIFDAVPHPAGAETLVHTPAEENPSRPSNHDADPAPGNRSLEDDTPTRNDEGQVPTEHPVDNAPEQPRPTIEEAFARHGERTDSGVSFHRDDPQLADLARRVPEDPNHVTVDAHVTREGNFRIGGHDYTPEEVGTFLRKYGPHLGWDGETPFRLAGCDAATNGAAARLSRSTGVEVLAATKPVWTDKQGRMYSSSAEVGPHGKLRPGIPPDGHWTTTRPDGTSTRATNDGYVPGTKDSQRASHIDPDGAVDRNSPTPPKGHTPQQLPNYQGNFHQDALDVVNALNGAGRPDLAQKFVDLVNREVSGDNAGGLKDWMDETVPRVRASDIDKVLDKAAELTELDRLAREIGHDPELKARFNPGVPGDKSFDILIERTTNGATTVERRIEVERMKNLPELSSNLHGPALHGADKAVAPTPNRIPTAESTVVMPTPPQNGTTLPLGGGNERRIGPNGFDYQIVDPNNNVRKTGNFLDELAKSFNNNKNVHPNLSNLDAVNIVDENGNLLGRIARGPNGWG